MNIGVKNSVQIETLYKRLYPKIYKYIYYHVQNKEETEELTQEVFKKVLMKFNSKKIIEDKVDAYIYRIAKNILIDKWRKKESRTNVISLQKTAEIASNIDENKRVEQAMLIKELLKDLKEDYRKVIVLRILKGYSIKEVAEITGKPEGTIKTIQFRALKLLKKKLMERKGTYEI